MGPGLEPGDYVIVNTWAYRRREPGVGDLVVLRDPQYEGRFLCKRIAAVPESGLYAVRGDDESVSLDSRSFGPIPRRLIVGKVWLAAKAGRRRTRTPESPS